MTARVLVVVFTFNHRDFIVEAMESVLAQKASFEFEVVVLDDCSTDGTREIVSEYARRYPGRVRTAIPEANRNNNTMFVEVTESSRAQYIALLDGDDFWTDPRKLQIQADFLDAHPESALCYHNWEIWDDAARKSLGIFNPPGHPPFSTLEDLLAASFIQTCSAMIRRETVVPFPEWYKGLSIGDWPLFLLAMRHGTAGYVDEVMSRYRLHPGGVWSGLTYREKLEQQVLFYDMLLGQFGDAFDDRIRVFLVRRCHELAFERTLAPGPTAASRARVAGIEARALEAGRETALRVSACVPMWSPEELLGASIDLPKSGAVVDSRCFTFAGWALGKDDPVIAVELEQDGRVLERVKVGMLRSDVADTFPGVSGAERSGFLAEIGVENRAASISIHAVAAVGRRMKMGEIRLAQDDGKDR